MFICLICLLHLQAMFNLQMDPSNYVLWFQLMELLLFIAVIITYDIYLSSMLVLFEIRIFNLFKYVRSMSLISLNLQQSPHAVCNPIVVLCIMFQQPFLATYSL
jgi:small basic protein